MSVDIQPWTEPPPPYTELDPRTADTVQAPPVSHTCTHSHTQSLGRGHSLSDTDTLPNPAQCLAHLQLLECFNRLRVDIGGTDGLFGIGDDLISPELNSQAINERLAMLCEKRWQI